LLLIIQMKKFLNNISVYNNQNLYLTGGFLRDQIWTQLHNNEYSFENQDVDIIYYSNIIDRNEEKSIERFLFSNYPNFNWSVKNQARMHMRNKHSRYLSLESALMCFPETASAIALNGIGDLIAPFGVNDLITLKLKPTPFCFYNEIDVFENRIHSKKWLNKFINLKKYYTQHRIGEMAG